MSDGECSKISYATCAKDRYGGFGTFAGFGAVDPEIACAKLATQTDGARRSCCRWS